MNFKLPNAQLSIITTAILCCWSCQRINYFEEQNQIQTTKTIVLAHAASGNSNEYRRNTLEAAKFGFEVLDGIEIDVAISKNFSLWLSHDAQILINGEYDDYFINVSDDVISNVIDENGKLYYHKLEDILSYMSENLTNNLISLDVKHPQAIFSDNAFDAAADEICNLVDKYKLDGKVVIESNSISFLKKFANIQTNIETYIMVYGDYEKGVSKAYSNGFTGFSFDYGRNDELVKESIDLAHSLGIKVLAYYINDDVINIGYEIGADIIETDNMSFYELLEN